MTSRQAFTLVELLVGVIVVGILSTAAIVSYQGAYEEARMQECEANQAILTLAIREYFSHDDTLPVTLSALPSEDIQRAYARWQRERPWTTRAWARVQAWWEGMAEAATGVTTGCPDVSRLPVPRRALECPSDPDPLSKGGVSYTINCAIRTRADYEKPENADKDLVYDADALGTSKIEYRHVDHGRKTAVVTKTRGKPERRHELKTTRFPGGPGSTGIGRQGGGHGGGKERGD